MVNQQLSTHQVFPIRSITGPSGRRLGMILLLMATVFVSHFNRVSMATAGDTRIMRQYEISPTRMGLVYSAYLLVYTICMIPGGLFIDRFGARAALITLGFGSAVFVGLTGVVGLSFHDAGAVFPRFAHRPGVPGDRLHTASSRECPSRRQLDRAGGTLEDQRAGERVGAPGNRRGLRGSSGR